MAEIKKFQTLEERVEERMAERENTLQKKYDKLHEKKKKAGREGTVAFLTPEDKTVEKMEKLKKETDRTLNEIQLRSANGRGVSDQELMNWMRDCIALGAMEAEVLLGNGEETE